MLMKNNITFSLLLVSLGSLLFSCDIRDNEVLPGQDFVRIYETGEFERSYIPLDVQPTLDGGYLILAAARVSDSDFLAAYLLKVNQEGLVEWEQLSEKYVNPVSELIPAVAGGGAGDAFTFVAMDKQQLGTHIVSVNAAAIKLPDGEAGEAAEGAEQGNEEGTPTVTEISQAPELLSVAYFGTATYPLAGAGLKGGHAILHWKRDQKSRMQLSRIRDNAELWTESYHIFEDVEPRIMGHLTSQMQPLVPFGVGELENGHLYFIGYNNFTLSLSFVNGNTGKQTGVVNGTRYASGISQVTPLKNGAFALARYRESGENIYAPAVALDHMGIATAKDLPGNELPELVPYARVKIRQETVNSEAITFYAGDTKNGQIAVFAYDEDGVLRGSSYLGAGNRFETGNIRVTPDGGLVVVGRSFVAGRFPRLSLFKLSAQELREMLRQ